VEKLAINHYLHKVELNIQQVKCTTARFIVSIEKIKRRKGMTGL
jgi:hypothetical protein